MSLTISPRLGNNLVLMIEDFTNSTAGIWMRSGIIKRNAFGVHICL